MERVLQFGAEESTMEKFEKGTLLGDGPASAKALRMFEGH